MAAIALITAGRVEVVESHDQKTQQAGVEITAGQAVITGAAGTWVLAESVTNNAGVHVATKSAHLGEPLTAIRAGRMDGFDVSAMAYNASVFLSDTAGTLSTTAGTNSIIIGRVEAAAADPLGTSPDKILRIAAPL